MKDALVRVVAVPDSSGIKKKDDTAAVVAYNPSVMGKTMFTSIAAASDPSMNEIASAIFASDPSANEATVTTTAVASDPFMAGEITVTTAVFASNPSVMAKTTVTITVASINETSTAVVASGPSVNETTNAVVASDPSVMDKTVTAAVFTTVTTVYHLISTMIPLYNCGQNEKNVNYLVTGTSQIASNH